MKNHATLMGGRVTFILSLSSLPATFSNFSFLISRKRANVWSGAHPALTIKTFGFAQLYYYHSWTLNYLN